MKTVSPGPAAHLAGEVTTLATCWRMERADGWIRGFTDHDQDLVVDGMPYVAATGFLPSAVKSGSDLSVDNLDVEGFLDDDALKAADLTAGLFDGAKIEFFLVNWADLGQGKLILRKKAGSARSSAPTSVSRPKSAGSQTSCSRPTVSSIPGSAASTSARRNAPSTSPRSRTTSLWTKSSPRDQIVITTARPSGFFTFGKTKFLTGANAGASNEVRPSRSACDPFLRADDLADRRRRYSSARRRL